MDGALQPRESLDQAVVIEYAEAMEAGDAFPPVMVFYDGAVFWLADGWHRVSAARSVRGKTSIAAEIREGTRQDALLYSVGANAAHGLRRSNADKRKAVERVLADPEWATWSDREIARVCSVGHPLVAKIRKDVTGIDSSERTYTTKHGTVATMETAQIAVANEARASVSLDRDLPAESVRTETLVVPFGKDAELIGKVRRTQARFPEPMRTTAPVVANPVPLKPAPMAQLEAGIERYLQALHGPMSRQTFAIRASECRGVLQFEDYHLLMEHVALTPEQDWNRGDMREALKNVIARYKALDQAAEEMDRQEQWRVKFAPVPAEEVGEASPLPAPAAAAPPREPSAWAPELKPKQDQEQTPDSPKLPENATIVEVATRVAVLSDEVIKRGMWPATYKPAMDLAEASRVLASMVLEMAYGRGALPEHPAVTEAMSAATQRAPIAVGAAVRWGDRTGTLTAWKANNRTAEVQDVSGRRYTMPAFMVQAIEAEPA